MSELKDIKFYFLGPHKPLRKVQMYRSKHRKEKKDFNLSEWYKKFGKKTG